MIKKMTKIKQKKFNNAADDKKKTTMKNADNSTFYLVALNVKP
jgi:hypothetical protein